MKVSLFEKAVESILKDMVTKESLAEAEKALETARLRVTDVDCRVKVGLVTMWDHSIQFMNWN